MPYREQIPIDKGLDNSLKMRLEGYRYISNQRERFGRDMFETRILGGQKAICIAGKEAAQLFYDESRIKRQGAAPKRVRQTLFGEQAIQTMDGKRHKHRKSLFMSLMTEKSLEDIISIFKNEWKNKLAIWENQHNVVLYQEVVEILTKSACIWTGVPITEKEIKQRAKQLESLYDSAASVGPKHWKGRTSRNMLEQWLMVMIKGIRNGKLTVQEDSPFYKIALYRDTDGQLLAERVAAVEVLNILRPIVAISVYITFVALALEENPKEKENARQRDGSYQEMFVQEVRRYYPFFPYATGRVKEDFLWKGHDFKKENLILLDIYGTNHHSDLWEYPYEFKPERFTDRKEDPFDFISQGGGHYETSHRCPGEWLTIEIMKASLELLVNDMEYNVPEQNLEYSMVRIPSLPKSRMILNNVRKI